MSANDNEFDFVNPEEEEAHLNNAEEEEEEELGVQQGERGGRRRGPDVAWREVDRYIMFIIVIIITGLIITENLIIVFFLRFDSREQFLATDMSTELKSFYLKKAWTNRMAENETWACKFAKKSGFKKCGCLLKLEFLSHSSEVVMFDNGVQHLHEPDLEYMTGGRKYLWSRVQEEVLLPLVRNKMSAVVCLRELKKNNAPNSFGIYPTLAQINSKKKYMYQKVVMDELVLLDTADLRNYIDEKLAVPEDPDECYVVDWSIDDSDVVTGKPRFTVTFSTVNLLKRLLGKFIQDDATYKMNWMGHPVLTHGVSTDTGRFFLSHVTLSSHEDTQSWATNFSFVKRVAGIPRFNMADGAWEISKGAEEAFGTELRTRLMCWSHVYRNIRPKLASIRKVNKELGSSILSDIEALQWMTQTADEFNRLTDLLVKHYTSNPALSANELDLVTTFFDYFLQQWGPGSHVQNWYAGNKSIAQENVLMFLKMQAPILSQWTTTKDLKALTLSTRRITPFDLKLRWENLCKSHQTW